MTLTVWTETQCEAILENLGKHPFIMPKCRLSGLKDINDDLANLDFSPAQTTYYKPNADGDVLPVI
jgi:hypothetical protein